MCDVLKINKRRRRISNISVRKKNKITSKDKFNNDIFNNDLSLADTLLLFNHCFSKNGTVKPYAVKDAYQKLQISQIALGFGTGLSETHLSKFSVRLF